MKWLKNLFSRLIQTFWKNSAGSLEITSESERKALRVPENSRTEALASAMSGVCAAADAGGDSLTHYITFDDQGNAAAAGYSLSSTPPGSPDVVVTNGPPVREVGSKDVSGSLIPGKITDPDNCVSSRHLYHKRQRRDCGVSAMPPAELEQRISEHKAYIEDINAKAAEIETRVRENGERVARQMLSSNPDRARLIGDIAVAELSKDGPALDATMEAEIRQKAVADFVALMGEQAVNDLRVRGASKLYGPKPYQPFVFGHEADAEEKAACRTGKV